MAVRRRSRTPRAEPKSLHRPRESRLQPTAPIRIVRHPPVPREYLEFAGADAFLAVRYREDAMAGRDEKVSLELDAEIVERARVQLGLDRASDATVVERALNAYLLGRLLDATQSSAGLTEHDAERIAYEELRSSRRERGAA
jgi:hypothetical protein